MTAPFAIPFDKEGNMMKRSWGQAPSTKENYEFSETMTIVGYPQGKYGTSQFTLRDSQGKTYCMFMRYAFDMISKNTIAKGQLSGTWTFMRNGAYYGLKFIRTNQGD